MIIDYPEAEYTERGRRIIRKAVMAPAPPILDVGGKRTGLDYDIAIWAAIMEWKYAQQETNHGYKHNSVDEVGEGVH